MPLTRSAGPLALWLILAAASFGVGFVTRYHRGEKGVAAAKLGESAAIDRGKIPAGAKGRSRRTEAPTGTGTSLTAQELIAHYDASRMVESKAHLHSLIGGLEPAAFAPLVAEIAAMRDPESRYAILSVLVERWAELDPRQVVELAVTGEAAEQARVLMLRTGFAALARVAPMEAREFALQAKVDNFRRDVLEPMFTALGEVDPGTALLWLEDRELIPQKDLDPVAAEFFGAWAESDPAAAGAALVDHASEWTVEAVAEIWARVDPKAVAHWAAQFESSKLKESAADGIIEVTVAGDGGAFARDVLAKLFPDKIPPSLISRLGRQMFEHDVEAGLKWFAPIAKEEVDSSVGQNLAAILGSYHPDRIPEFLALIPDEASRVRMIDTLARTWSRRDADAALVWANSLAGSEHTAALSALATIRPELITALANLETLSTQQIAGHARQMIDLQGPKGAREWIDKLPTAEQRLAAFDAAAGFWNGDPLAKAEFVESFDFGEGVDADRIRETRLGEVAKLWGRTDPEGAAAWAEEHGLQRAADEVRGAAIKRMVVRGNRAEAAAQLVRDLEALSQRAEGTPRSADPFQSAAAGLTHEWTRRDPEAATEWVASIPESRLRGLTSYWAASTWADTDPAAALAWASDLAEAPMREKALLGTFSSWAERDPAAAGRALEKLPLNEEERKTLRAEFPETEGGAP